MNIAQIGFAADTPGQPWICSLPWSPVSQNLARQILNPNGADAPLLLAHNAQYDVAHLEAAGIEVDESRLIDTMLAAQLLEPDLPKALGAVAPRYLNVQPWKHLDEQDLARYNARDAEITLLLWHRMERLLADRGQLEFFRNAIMPGSMTLRRMTKRGIRLSQEHLRSWHLDLAQAYLILLNQWDEEVGKVTQDRVDPQSSKQLAKLFYETLGLPQLVTTKKGAPSTNKDALAKLARKVDHPLLHLLMEVRQKGKMLATYVTKPPQEGDGCVHPQYLPERKDEGDYGTASMRLASRNPNIQNQPAEARFQYVPHHNGWVIGESDFSQIEGRLVAILSGDASLVEGYATGADLHQRNADLWGVSRRTAKGILYAMQYGAGAKTLAGQFEVGLSTARGWLSAYQQAHPAVWAWQQDVIRRAATYGYLENGFGIRRYFPGLARDDSHVRNQALNFLPQSLVAGITWMLLAPLEREIEALGGHLLTQVHDSFVWEGPAEQAEQIAAAVRRLMEQPWPQIAPGWSCPTSVTVGETWGHATQNDEEARDGQSGLDVWIQKGRPAYRGG